jgi:hypothetical protein
METHAVPLKAVPWKQSQHDSDWKQVFLTLWQTLKRQKLTESQLSVACSKVASAHVGVGGSGGRLLHKSGFSSRQSEQSHLLSQ